MNTIKMTNVVTRGLLTLLLATGMLHAAAAQETVEYVHTDGLGSPVAVTDTSGTVVERTAYEPYGAVVNGAAKDGPGYSGHVADSATGLSYMQQRYMDPYTATFISVDAVSAYSQPVGAFGRYRYGNNNPYKYLDPDGNEGKVAWLVKLTSNGMRKLSRLTKEQAINARRAEQNIVADRRQVGSQIETASTGGRAEQLKHKSHDLEDGSKGLPHYQTEGKRGHTFWGKLSVAAAAASGAMDQVAEASEYVPDPMPRLATQADISRYNNVMGKISEMTGLPTPGVRMGVNGEFKGYFRVDGRLDAKRLTKELDIK
ncbi:RHS repeat domain-containing protein [Stenotrophomonas sp. NPDC077464]|uniref:RHS repeat domain-containing protein n=1 Tax=unclassified Stenotrophomonas TaxID=196198 RepID=UPI0037D1852E